MCKGLFHIIRTLSVQTMRRLILFVVCLTFAQAIKDKCKVDYTSCPSGSKWSLCLEVKLSNDDSKMIVLKKDFGCTFKGHFLHQSGTTVFAAADNCPINRNTTDLRVSSINPILLGRDISLLGRIGYTFYHLIVHHVAGLRENRFKEMFFETSTHLGQCTHRKSIV